MEFTPTDTQLAVQGVVSDAFDKGGGTWEALASAGLLGLAVPQEHGGDGLGLGEVGVVLHETGRRAAYLPVLETLCLGVLPVARCGTAAQR